MTGGNKEWNKRRVVSEKSHPPCDMSGTDQYWTECTVHVCTWEKGMIIQGQCTSGQINQTEGWKYIRMGPCQPLQPMYTHVASNDPPILLPRWRVTTSSHKLHNIHTQYTQYSTVSMCQARWLYTDLTIHIHIIHTVLRTVCIICMWIVARIQRVSDAGPGGVDGVAKSHSSSFLLLFLPTTH